MMGQKYICVSSLVKKENGKVLYIIILFGSRQQLAQNTRLSCFGTPNYILTTEHVSMETTINGFESHGNIASKKEIFTNHMS